MNPHPIANGGGAPLAKASACCFCFLVFQTGKQNVDSVWCGLYIYKKSKSTQKTCCILCKKKKKNPKNACTFIHHCVCVWVCVCVRLCVCCPGNAVPWSTVCEGLDLRQTGSQSLSSQQPTSLSATLAATKSIMFDPLCHFPHHGVRRVG